MIRFLIFWFESVLPALIGSYYYMNNDAGDYLVADDNTPIFGG